MFKFRQFGVNHDRSALKVGTDAVLLGASMTLPDRPDAVLLDIGTGCGVISLMVAQRFSSTRPSGYGALSTGGWKVVGIDIDVPSAEEAAENFQSSPWSGHLKAAPVSLADFAASSQERFDCIFSNPPYYDNSLLNPDSRASSARHTLELSYREILAFAAERLTEDGTLSLVLPAECGKELVRCAVSFGLYPFRILSVRTTVSKPVRRIVAEFSRRKCECAENALILQNGISRSPEYAALTEEFYL